MAHGHAALDDLAGRAVNGDDVTFVQQHAGRLQRLALEVDVHGGGADHARASHAPRDHGRVARHTATRGQDADGGMHALHVLRRRLDARQDHGVPLRFQVHGLVGVEHDLARGGARRCRQALGEHDHLGLGVEGRVKQLIELVRVETRYSLLAGDQPLPRHVHGDLKRGLGRAFARAGLQHEELAFLHGKLDVLDVTEALLKRGTRRLQFGEGLGHERFQRGLAVAGCAALRLGQRLGRAQARHHVLALRVQQELAEKLLGAGRRIAGEDDTGRAVVAPVAEHHGLDGNGRAPIVGDVVETPIGDGTRILPRAEHGGDGAPELLAQVLRERPL